MAREIIESACKFMWDRRRRLKFLIEYAPRPVRYEYELRQVIAH